MKRAIYSNKIRSSSDLDPFPAITSSGWSAGKHWLTNFNRSFEASSSGSGDKDRSDDDEDDEVRDGGVWAYDDGDP